VKTDGKVLNAGPLPRRERRPVVRSLARERRCVANSMRTRMPRNRTSSTLTSAAIFFSILHRVPIYLRKTNIHKFKKKNFIIKIHHLW
jgi:hypothetical protein